MPGAREALPTPAACTSGGDRAASARWSSCSPSTTCWSARSRRIPTLAVRRPAAPTASPCTTTPQIDERVNLVRSLVNSGIFTGGVILCTVVFGLLAGYALARLHFRGARHAVRGRCCWCRWSRSSC